MDEYTYIFESSESGDPGDSRKSGESGPPEYPIFADRQFKIFSPGVPSVSVPGTRVNHDPRLIQALRAQGSTGRRPYQI